MMSDAAARTILARVWPGRALAEYQIVQAIGRFEGRYGSAFAPPGEGPPNNWGAISAGVAPCDPLTSVPATDSHSDGSAFAGCFKRYPTPDAGALALVQQLTTRRPATGARLKTGNADAVAMAMRTTDPTTHVLPYFEGHGSLEEAVSAYASAIFRNATDIAKNLKEPLAVKRGGPSAPQEGFGEALLAMTLGGILAVIASKKGGL